MQLTEIQDQIAAMGFNIAAMTYDSVELLKDVELDQGIEYKLLRDEEMEHFVRYGILNDTDYEPGDRAWGVPYPGIMLISPDGVIRAKFAEEGYRTRPPWEDVLAAAADM